MTVSSDPTPVALPQQAKAGATAQAQAFKRQDIHVQLQYLKDDPLYKTTKPIQITPNFADKEHRTNVHLAPGKLETLHDVRGLGGQPLGNFSLDEHGFEYVKGQTAFKDWGSQPKIGQEYLPELEALLQKEVDGCDEILFYDARIRQAGDEGLRVEGLNYNPFAKQVHTDNTEKSVIDKIKNMTEMKADYLLSGRARIINIWRPIKHPVYDCGLAIADGGKLKEEDVMECDRHRADTGEYWDTMGVIKYREGFDWYYCSEQAEEDVLLFKNYDSATNVKARYCLHTAFDVPPDVIPPGAPTRESIEVRALIFTYPIRGRRPSGPIQHPLALTLEQGQLRHLDDEHISITDRLRTDIDEGNEIKDAVLLLRKHEIRRLEGERDALINERNGLIGDLMAANSERDKALYAQFTTEEQVKIQAASLEALQAEVNYLKMELSQSHPELRRQLNGASRELVDVRMHKATRSRGESDNMQTDREKTLLLQTIDRQEQEIQKWKAEAMGKGDEAVSRSWQGGVDEAVRREREKDAFVVKALQEEIERLKGGSTA